MTWVACEVGGRDLVGAVGVLGRSGRARLALRRGLRLALRVTGPSVGPLGRGGLRELARPLRRGRGALGGARGASAVPGRPSTPVMYAAISPSRSCTSARWATAAARPSSASRPSRSASSRACWRIASASWAAWARTCSWSASARPAQLSQLLLEGGPARRGLVEPGLLGGQLGGEVLRRPLATLGDLGLGGRPQLGRLLLGEAEHRADAGPEVAVAVHAHRGRRRRHRPARAPRSAPGRPGGRPAGTGAPPASGSARWCGRRRRAGPRRARSAAP